SSFVSSTAPNPENGETNTIENSYFYVKDNDISNAYLSEISSRALPYLKTTPLYRSTYLPLPTTGLRDKLLSDVGAGALTSQGIDSHDLAMVGNINAKNGTVSDTGPYPTISGGAPYPQTIITAIDDAWTTLHTISSASQVKSTYTIDGKTIINDAGYTALEIFLAELAGDFERLPLDAPVAIPVIILNGSNPMTLQVGQAYVEAGATATNTSNEVVITGT